MYIAFLDSALNAPLSRKQRLRLLFLEEGAEIREHTGLPDSIRKFIDDAASMILWNDHFLYDNETVVHITNAVKSGKRLLANLDQDHMAKMNEFLRPFGIEGTSIGITNVDLLTPPEDPITISKPKHADSFHDIQILEKVETVTVSRPRAIRYGGQATPVLTLPLDDTVPLDFATDLLEEWLSPDFACVARSEPAGFEGGVLALSGGFFGDPTRNATGIYYPGINLNEQLCRNIARWLVGVPEPPFAQTRRGFDLIDKIERSLVEYVTTVLHDHEDDWWSSYIPEKVRTKCSRRAAEEFNRFPGKAYLDILDLKRIIDANWQFFEPHFVRIKGRGDKSQALDWIDDLNKIRKHVMHPTRRLFSGEEISNDQLAFLNESLTRVNDLIEFRHRATPR